MRAILEFELPEDGVDFAQASRAAEMAAAITEVDDTLRCWLKYGSGPKDLGEVMLRVRGLMADVVELARGEV